MFFNKITMSVEKCNVITWYYAFCGWPNLWHRGGLGFNFNRETVYQGARPILCS